jgi:hypothetical protein
VTFGWVLLLVTLASYRLTRLVVDDTFPPVQWVRDRVVGDDPAVPRWRGVPAWVGDLVSCSWCASVWVSAGVTALTWVWIGLPVPLLVWAGAATGAAWLSHLEEYFQR